MNSRCLKTDDGELVLNNTSSAKFAPIEQGDNLMVVKNDKRGCRLRLNPDGIPRIFFNAFGTDGDDVANAVRAKGACIRPVANDNSYAPLQINDEILR